jgi:hypothetical protein
MAPTVSSGTNMGTSSESEMSQSATNLHAEKRKSPGSNGTVDWGEQSRQWDLRVNLGPGDCTLEEAERELEWFLERVKSWENIRYVLIGGIEVGSNPSQDDFQRHHVHGNAFYFSLS